MRALWFVLLALDAVVVTALGGLFMKHFRRWWRRHQDDVPRQVSHRD